MKQIKWIDRTFFFGYDKGYIPCFIERLSSTAPRLDELMNGCSEFTASQKKGTEWSVKEHIGHLSDLETLHDGRIDDFINNFGELRPADMTNKETFAGGHNGRTIPQLLSHFRHTRNNFITRVGSLDTEIFNRKALHPRLKQVITLTDLLFFIAEHDNHHMARIATL
jgi:uncharacterized damage-inducible protein DinB